MLLLLYCGRKFYFESPTPRFQFRIRSGEKMGGCERNFTETRNKVRLHIRTSREIQGRGVSAKSGYPASSMPIRHFRAKREREKKKKARLRNRVDPESVEVTCKRATGFIYFFFFSLSCNIFVSPTRVYGRD